MCSDLGGDRTRDSCVTGQGRNHYTKNLKITYNEQITLFESNTQNRVIFDLGSPHSAIWFYYLRAPQICIQTFWDLKIDEIRLSPYV